MDEDYYDDYLGCVTCWKCAGEGFLIVCVDDLCHGTGHCMHGDGEVLCPECDGDGYL